MSTHAVPQFVSPTAQAARQVPAEHASPGAQAWPQAPQLAASLPRSAQVPLHDVTPPPHPVDPTQIPWIQLVPEGQSALEWQVMVTLGPQLAARNMTRPPMTARHAAVQRRSLRGGEARKRGGLFMLGLASVG